MQKGSTLPPPEADKAERDDALQQVEAVDPSLSTKKREL